jgi:Na+/proline symporter
MFFAIVSALILSFAVYLFIGFKLGKSTKGVGDMLPISGGKQASVRNSSEFSASTVATTISLATVVVAFYELVPYFGVWLFWCVLTTSAGIFVVRLIAPKIWERLSNYKTKPSLHEFLGLEYESDSLALVGAVCTSLGFLGAFAVELTVGSRFLADLIHGFPQWMIVAILSVVAFVYTSAGGFRAVIVTDKIQMVAIWLLLIGLSVFTIYFITSTGGWEINSAKIPTEVKTFSWRAGLGTFMVGIFIINIFSYASDMSVWQRISASEDPKTILQGLGKSVSISALTWTILVALACLVYVAITPVAGENPLITLLAFLGLKMGFFGKIILFLVILGLFGAMLSTASTQLIAVSHTIYEDISAKLRKISLANRLESKKELTLSRVLLIYAALVAVIIVEILTYYGFSVADMVSAVYGAQLGLFPPIILALFLKKEKLKPISNYAKWAIIAGFVGGWGSEIINKMLEMELAFISPIISLSVSSLIVLVGLGVRRN